ncbi:MAG: F0F1 ATP synthase subunit B [Clostridiaceae bacterium]|nr:F0F1 ATP synthase subunit B [Clostridiaceae bacterium]
MEALEKLKLEPSTVLFTLINFLILVLILKHFFWDKIKLAIDERKDYIESQFAKAEEDSDKARRYLIENQRILKASKEEGNKIIEEKKNKATKVYDEIVADANKESKAIIERANIEIQRQKEKAEYELKNHVVDLAIDISTKALQETVEESKQRELINDFINKVGK